MKQAVDNQPVPNRDSKSCLSLVTIQSGLRMGGNGILWILCLGQILSAGAMPMSDDEEGLLLLNAEYLKYCCLFTFHVNSVQVRG